MVKIWNLGAGLIGSLAVNLKSSRYTSVVFVLSVWSQTILESDNTDDNSFLLSDDTNTGNTLNS